jgi:hypothetical protein
MLARILGPQKLLLGLTGAAALLTVGLVGAAGSSSAAPAAAGGAALAADATSYDPVPSAIRVPPGNRLVARLDAQGVQVYQCTAGAWGFLEPVAALSDRSPADATIHFRGPSWESIRDGSLVEATTIASSPVVGSIPQLLLQATRTRGDGIFGSVTYVQRLNTTGGVIPTTACTDGQTRGVPYTAEYRFYVKA